MEKRATRLKNYVEDRLGDSLRAVGYHSVTDVELEYIRNDLIEEYPEDKVEKFIEASRGVHSELQRIDEGMGGPEASLHMLEEGLIAQFHYPNGDVIFLSMDQEVGREFTQFMRECRAEMSQAND